MATRKPQIEDGELCRLLRDEYLFLQKTYEDFDGRVLTIKGWSVTLSLGGIVLGFQYSKPSIWFIAALAGLLFWILEAMWKTFQSAYAPRIQEIEIFFRGQRTPESFTPFQIYDTWFSEYQSNPFWRELLSYMLLPLVCLPHVVSIATAVILLIAHAFKLI